MVMAGVTIVAIAVVAIVASDDHYRGVGPVSPVVGLRAVVRIVVVDDLHANHEYDKNFFDHIDCGDHGYP